MKFSWSYETAKAILEAEGHIFHFVQAIECPSKICVMTLWGLYPPEYLGRKYGVRWVEFAKQTKK